MEMLRRLHRSSSTRGILSRNHNIDVASTSPSNLTHSSSNASRRTAASPLFRRRLHGHSIRRRVSVRCSELHDGGAPTGVRESRLAGRVADSGATLRVVEIPGGRLRFQIRSLRCALAAGQQLRSDSVAGGAGGIAERQHRWPAFTQTVCDLYGRLAPRIFSPLPARAFRQIGLVPLWLGSALIRTLATESDGHLATRCLAMSRSFRDVASEWCARSEVGLYYGVDVEKFRPADAGERARLRLRLNLPPEQISHRAQEPESATKRIQETVLRAVALARGRGLDAVLLESRRWIS